MMSKINLIGGVDSFGVAYTRDNKEHVGHLDVVKAYLEEHGNSVVMLDAYSMNTYNNTSYIEKMLRDDLDFYTIRSNQRQGIDLCRRNGIFQFIQLPRKTRDLYPEELTDKEKHICEFLREKNTIFVYSCGINDFLGLMSTDLGKLIFPKNMDKALVDIETSIAKVIDLVKANFDLLFEINPNMEIYVLGIYTPTKYSYIRNVVSGPIGLFNMALADLCSGYDNVTFVDNSNLTVAEMAPVDWHPNLAGQKMIGTNIIACLKRDSKILKK